MVSMSGHDLATHAKNDSAAELCCGTGRQYYSDGDRPLSLVNPKRPLTRRHDGGKLSGGRADNQRR